MKEGVRSVPASPENRYRGVRPNTSLCHKLFHGPSSISVAIDFLAFFLYFLRIGRASSRVRASTHLAVIYRLASLRPAESPASRHNVSSSCSRRVRSAKSVKGDDGMRLGKMRSTAPGDDDDVSRPVQLVTSTTHVTTPAIIFCPLVTMYPWELCHGETSSSFLQKQNTIQKMFI